MSEERKQLKDILELSSIVENAPYALMTTSMEHVGHSGNSSHSNSCGNCNCNGSAAYTKLESAAKYVGSSCSSSSHSGNSSHSASAAKNYKK